MANLCAQVDLSTPGVPVRLPSGFLEASYALCLCANSRDPQCTSLCKVMLYSTCESSVCSSNFLRMNLVPPRLLPPPINSSSSLNFQSLAMMTPDDGITSTAATSGEINPQKRRREEDTQEACSNASIGEDTDEEAKSLYLYFYLVCRNV
ncbi:hypothetical protein CROQUDRAFT_100946 [Cronartium quercuum f. sp. fusiforme G11]|uniref:Uncharacterized protein n=1 Tax=Cronartium quercuum f. sp. fusiforme G11 TaxID=708437 RepID=A0A9P6N9M8_9BASI|nr:hypothetical protein CROQUDRAFT_100946 [Cronartium quercuum f. sp. fusiforme G11]